MVFVVNLIASVNKLIQMSSFYKWFVTEKRLQIETLSKRIARYPWITKQTQLVGQQNGEFERVIHDPDTHPLKVG